MSTPANASIPPSVANLIRQHPHTFNVHAMLGPQEDYLKKRVEELAGKLDRSKPETIVEYDDAVTKLNLIYKKRNEAQTIMNEARELASNTPVPAIPPPATVSCVAVSPVDMKKTRKTKVPKKPKKPLKIAFYEVNEADYEEFKDWYGPDGIYANFGLAPHFGKEITFASFSKACNEMQKIQVWHEFQNFERELARNYFFRKLGIDSGSDDEELLEQRTAVNNHYSNKRVFK